MPFEVHVASDVGGGDNGLDVWFGLNSEAVPRFRMYTFISIEEAERLISALEEAIEERRQILAQGQVTP